MQSGSGSKLPLLRLLKSLFWFFPRVGAGDTVHLPLGDSLQMPLYRDVTFRFVSLAFTLLLIPGGFWHLVAERSGVGLITLLLALPLAWHCWMQLEFDRPWLSPLAVMGLAALVLQLAFYTGGVGALYWASAWIVSCHFVLARKQAIIFNSVFLLLLMPAAWQGLSGSTLLMFLFSQVFIGVTAGVFNWVVFTQEQKLQQVAVRDPLTLAFNRRTMMERVDHTLHLNQRYDTMASLILLDIDHFKRVNDQLGHNVGDSVLKEVVRLLQLRLRRTDVLFRYGGEEFIVLLSATEARVALQLAQQCCRLIRDARILPRRVLTVSCGVAEIVPGESALDWLERCDQALYRAKNSGRNQACLAPSVRS